MQLSQIKKRKFNIAQLLDELHNRLTPSSLPIQKKKKKEKRKAGCVKTNVLLQDAQVTVSICMCAFPPSCTDLYILRLSLDESAECLKSGCNHADRRNRRLRWCCGSASWGHTAPLTCTRQYLAKRRHKVMKGKHDVVQATLSDPICVHKLNLKVHLMPNLDCGSFITTCLYYPQSMINYSLCSLLK